MDTTLALHPQTLEALPDAAPDSDTGEGVPWGGVDGVEVVPCTSEFDPTEARTYGSVSACVLASLAVEMLTHRIRAGFGGMFHQLFRYSHPVRHALYVYSRVKAAIKKLSDPITLEIKVEDGTYVPRFPVCVEPVGIEVEEPEIPPILSKDWIAIDNARGHDVRGTSLHWVERRVESARRNAKGVARRRFIKDNGLAKAKQTPQQLARMAEAQKRKHALNLAFAARAADYEPPVNLMPRTTPTFGEIWPPVPLPDRKTVSVTVKPVPATNPKPTMDEVEPVIGIENDYAEYAYHQYGYIQSGPKWALPSMPMAGEALKPP